MWQSMTEEKAGYLFGSMGDAFMRRAPGNVLWWCIGGLAILAGIMLYQRRVLSRVFPLLLILGLLAGCASTPMNVIMTNPATGKSIYVSHSSWGWGMAGVAAALNAEQQQQKAFTAAKMLGYTDMQEVK